MFTFGAKIFSSVRDLYNELNPATLTGAVDVIVVEQPDGSFACTPFYVRFGKMGVLRSREKMVDVTINDESVDLFLKLDDTGEAYFVEDNGRECEVPVHLATSPLPTSRLLIDQMADEKARSASPFKVGEREILRKKKLSENDVRPSAHLESLSIRGADSASTRTKNRRKASKRENLRRRRTRRSCSWHGGRRDLAISTIADGDEEVFDEAKFAKAIGQNGTSSPIVTSISDASLMSTKPVDPQKVLFSADGNETTTEDIFHLEFSEDENEDSKETKCPNIQYETVDEPLIIDKPLTVQIPIASEIFNSETASAPLLTGSSTSDDSPRKEAAQSYGSRWDFSSVLGLGFIRKSTSSAAPKIVEEGIYLDDLMPQDDSNQINPQLASMYLENRKRNLTGDRYVGYKTRKSVSALVSRNEKILSSSSTDIDDGYGSNKSSSDVVVDADRVNLLCHRLDRMKRLEPLNGITVSLCGIAELVTDIRFDSKKVVFDDFVKNPDLIFARDLVLRINDRYYGYRVAIPALISILIFDQSLPKRCLDKLCNANEIVSAPVIVQPQSTAETMTTNVAAAGSWFPWRRAASAEPKNPPLHLAKTFTNSFDSDSNSPKTDHKELTSTTSLRLPSSNSDEEALSDGELTDFLRGRATTSSRYKKTLLLNSDQLKRLNLKRDVGNRATFSVTTKYQGTSVCECCIYLWRWDDKIVISDIDGTITRSDVLGHLMPIVGRQWEHLNVVRLFNAIADNGYRVMYLSARAIGQSQWTKDYLKSVRQFDESLPDGPLQLSPCSLLSAFHREVIEKKPEIFKTKCLRDIRAVFPKEVNPFYAGFGNRPNDEVAYTNSGVPTTKIFTINPTGEVRFLDKRMRSSYKHISEIMDHIFPPLSFKAVSLEKRRQSVFSAPETFSSYTYWRKPLVEIEVEDYDKNLFTENGKKARKVGVSALENAGSKK